MGKTGPTCDSLVPDSGLSPWRVPLLLCNKLSSTLYADVSARVLATERRGHKEITLSLLKHIIQGWSCVFTEC